MKDFGYFRLKSICLVRGLVDRKTFSRGEADRRAL
jgi:hypothetical protein